MFHFQGARVLIEGVSCHHCDFKATNCCLLQHHIWQEIARGQPDHPNPEGPKGPEGPEGPEVEPEEPGFRDDDVAELDACVDRPEAVEPGN